MDIWMGNFSGCFRLYPLILLFHLTHLRYDNFQAEDLAELDCRADLALVLPLVTRLNSPDPEDTCAIVINVTLVESTRGDHHTLINSDDYCFTSLSSQMLAALLMTEEILGSLVKASLSTTRMWPSRSRTQDTDLEQRVSQA